MDIQLVQIRKRPTGARILVGMGTFIVLALAVAFIAGNAEAAGAEQHPVNLSGDGDNAGSLLAAKETRKANMPSKDASNSGANSTKDVKQAAAKAPAGTPPSKYWIVNTLRANSALVIFLALALGYYVGSIKLGQFSLGPVTGTLLVGVLIGQLDIAISVQVKSMFFTLFLFAVGYSVGPQFVRGIARDGAPQALFAVVIWALCLATTYLVAKIAGFDVGYAAGMLAGAQTTSASIGLATDAINNSGIENAKEMINQIPVAYAICYLWGTIGTGIILSQIGPKMIGADLVEACKDYEAKLSQGQPATGMNSAWHQLQMRAFEVAPDSRAAGKAVADVERLQPGERMFIERIRRDGQIIEFDANTTFKAADVVAVSGPAEALVALSQDNKEVADNELIDVPVESIDVVVTSKDVDGKTLIDLSKADFTRGVYLSKITRGATSVDVPILAQTAVHRGDILKLTGTKTHIERIEKAIGYADRPSVMTDMVWIGLFIFVFGLIGSLSVKIGGVPLTLSVSMGVLIGGLVLGWLRSVRPTFGRLPAPTMWFMNSVGLNVFIAIVGISAGPVFISGLKAAGVGLLVCGMIATSVPMLLAPLIGRFIFKFHPALNLGACGGARTSTASVAMVGDVAKSNIPMLGYTVPYAINGTLMAMLGMVIVLIY